MLGKVQVQDKNVEVPKVLFFVGIISSTRAYIIPPTGQRPSETLLKRDNLSHAKFLLHFDDTFK